MDPHTVRPEFSGRDLAEYLTGGREFFWDDGTLEREALERRAETRGLDPDLLSWRETAMVNALLTAQCLGENELAKACGKAWSNQIAAIARLQQELDNGRKEAITAEEVARVRRDIGYNFLAASVALGGRDYQAGLEDGADVRFQNLKNRGNAGYEVKYAICFDEIVPPINGDYEWQEDGDGIGKYVRSDGTEYYDEVHYPAKLIISLNPSQGLSIGLTHDLESSSVHYTQVVQQNSRSGKPVERQLNDCNVRIDKDDYSPAGVATDMGRSFHDGATYRRPGDLLGRVTDVLNVETGSHIYDGFTPEMKSDLAPLVEELIVMQDLVRRRVEDTGDDRMPVLSQETDANNSRYNSVEELRAEVERLA